jgi:hypothetical protein
VLRTDDGGVGLVLVELPQLAHPTRRTRRVVAEGALNWALAAEGRESVVVKRSPVGAAFTTCGLNISLSYTRRVAAVVYAAEGLRIGVDVEPLHRDVDVPSFRHALSAAGSDLAAGVATSVDAVRLWTRLEAVFKTLDHARLLTPAFLDDARERLPQVLSLVVGDTMVAVHGVEEIRSIQLRQLCAPHPIGFGHSTS